jgi:LuxR family maltose regulon positive regulatory protein
VEQAVAEHEIVLVTAPAGYGKTTLLARWAGRHAEPVAWVALDPLDDDPGRLARVLADAVLTVAVPAVGDRGTAPAASLSPAQHVDRLLAAAESVPPGAVLVLDDVHELSLTTARQVLAPLLRSSGAGIRLLMAARHDAFLPVNRLRSAGRLGEVRLRTLAFTAEEIEDAARALGVRSTPEAARALWEITGGWPVAVRLAISAGVLEHHGPMQQLRDRDVPLAGYLVEEVIDALPPDLSAFVLRAAFAADLDPETADALAPDGAGLLERAVARGLFLTTATADPHGVPSYRWHALVAEHARAVLSRRDPAAAREAHRVVARRLTVRDPAAAIQHALDGRAPDLAAAILTECWPDLVVRGDAGLIARLREALPRPHRDRPEVLLALAAAQGLGAGAPPDGDQRADGTTPEATAVVGDLVRVFLAPCRPALDEQVRRGARLLAREDLTEATSAFGLYLLGRAELQLPVAGADASAHLERAEALAAEHGWAALALGCAAERVLATAHRGEHAEVRRRAQVVREHAEAHGWADSSITAGALLAEGLTAYWADDLDLAHDRLTAALDAAGRLRPEIAFHAAVLLAITSLARGDAPGLAHAQRVIDAPWHEASAPEHRAAFRRLVQALRADYEHRPLDALNLVDQVPVLGQDVLALTWRSELHRRTGDLDAAHRALGLARAACTSGRAPVLDQHLVALHATEAVLHQERGAETRAHAALERALATADRQGVVRPLRDRSEALRPLLVDHLERGSAHDPLVARLLTADQAAPPVRASTWDLTARERDVLACLRSQLTTEEIAESMFVSINTVKSHLRAIYRKFGVDGRRSAVREAAARGLL